MAVTPKVGTGVAIHIGTGPLGNVITYSVTEDSTPVSADDSSGGYGQITISAREPDRPRYLRGQSVMLKDAAQGETSGIIRSMSGNGFKLDMQADAALSRAAVIRQAHPFIGTLGDALRYYLGLCGIITNIVVHPDLEDVPVSLLGWNANVYDQLKKLVVALGFEMSYVSENVVFRPLRGRIAVNYRDASITWGMDVTGLAQTVEAYSYKTTSGKKLAYPIGGWNEEVTIYSVEAGQVQEIDIPIDASLSSVDQPVCVDKVDRHHSSSSVYSVTGNDGLPVPPAQWAAGGGKLEVTIGEDTRTLKVKITGADDPQYAPYRIAVSSGTSDYYSSLRIVGTGVFYEKELHTLPAHTDKDRAPEEIGVTIDNEFIDSPDRAHHALLWAAARYSLPRITINVTSRGINRRDDNGSYRYPTIGFIKDNYPGFTIGEMYDALGPTVGDWNTKLLAAVQGDFENQAFGNIAGARVRFGDCWYRIRSATINPGSITYTAEWDNTIGDVYHHGETIGEWNARWAGMTIGEINEVPLQGLND